MHACRWLILIAIAWAANAHAGERLLDQIAAWSDRTGLVLVVDADVDLQRPASVSIDADSDYGERALQVFLAGYDLYAQAAEPGVLRIHRDGPGLDLIIVGQGSDAAARDGDSASTPSPARIFRPRRLPGGALGAPPQPSSDRRLRSIPNLYTVGELVSLRGIARGEDEAQFSLISHGLPVTPERLGAPLQLGAEPGWLRAVSGPDSALRGPNALGGWIEIGSDELLSRAGVIELRGGAQSQGLRGLWVPWAAAQRGQLALSAYTASQSSTVVDTASGPLPTPGDFGVELRFHWHSPDQRIETRSYLLSEHRQLGLPLLQLGPDQPDDPDLRESTLAYDGDIDSDVIGASQVLTLRRDDSTATTLELGWLQSSRDEHTAIDLLDAGDSINRRFRWSRLALSTELAHADRAPSRISLQFLPRRIERAQSTAVIPGGELFTLRDGLRNVGSGRLHFDHALDESLDSWLLGWDDQWSLGPRFSLALRAGWALERSDSALIDRARSDDDCLLQDVRSPTPSPCRTYFGDAEVTRRGDRSSAMALPAFAVAYAGDRSVQSLGWRNGYGRSRAALNLSSGVYRVYAPERIDALEYSIVDAGPLERWRVDAFAYHWRDRRSFRHRNDDLGSVLLTESDGGRALATGIELTTHQVRGRWSMIASAGWLSARYVGGEMAGIALFGKRLEDAPRYTASMFCAWRGDDGWFADVSLQLAGSSFVDATNQRDAQRPPMRLIDATVGRRFGPWEVFAYASDLSDDASYQSVLPRAGIGLLGNSYRIVVGPSVGLGLRWRWAPH